MTMTLVSSIQVGAGGATSIEFTGIPQTGTDLVVLISGRSTRVDVDDQIRVTFNSDAGTNYNSRYLAGTGSATTSSSLASAVYLRAGFYNAANNTANTFSNFSIYIPNYASSVAKSVSTDGVSENNATDAWQQIIAGSWTGTAAITSIQLDAGIGNWAQYSQASLYTITKGSGGATVS